MPAVPDDVHHRDRAQHRRHPTHHHLRDREAVHPADVGPVSVADRGVGGIVIVVVVKGTGGDSGAGAGLDDGGDDDAGHDDGEGPPQRSSYVISGKQ